MKTSDLGVQFIANEEGWRVGLTDRVYVDFAGKRTIGYGHLVGEDETFDEPISHDEALLLLAKDLARVERAVNDRVGVDINQNQFDALVSLVFNIGTGRFHESGCTVLRKLNAGDYGERVESYETWPNGDPRLVVTYTGAVGAFQMWNKATIDGRLQVSAVLVRRRQREMDVFLKPAG